MESDIQIPKHQQNPSTGPSSRCAKRRLSTPIGATPCQMDAWKVKTRRPVFVLQNAMFCEVLRTDSRKRVIGIEPTTFSLGS